MDASEAKQSRVTNTAIQSQLVELSVRLTRMEKDLQEIKNTLLESDKKIGDMGNYRDWETDRKSTRLNSSHITRSRMPSSA